MKSKKIKLGAFIQQHSGRSRRETFDLVKKGAVKLNNVICKDFSKLIIPYKDSVSLNISILSNLNGPSSNMTPDNNCFI